MSDPRLITDEATLRARCSDWGRQTWLTVDTEFVREDTYFPKLALVQVGTDRDAYCIDATAIADLSPLRDLLLRTDIIKVLHSASQDYEIFVQLWGEAPRPLVDTQVAANLLGLGDQMGYAALVETMLGLSIDKSLSRTPWLRRPLTPAEIDYACADVQHLAAIYPVLIERLTAQGRVDWLAEDCERLAGADRYRPNPALEWRRLKGLARLTPPAQRRAARLAAWRETVAVDRNRPRKWILADEALYTLAERAPEDHDDLRQLGVLPPKTLERHADSILRVLNEGGDEQATPLARDERADTELKTLLKDLSALVRARAEELQLPASLLAPRADLELLAAAGVDSGAIALQGWRRVVVGERLLERLGLPA